MNHLLTPNSVEVHLLTKGHVKLCLESSYFSRILLYNIPTNVTKINFLTIRPEKSEKKQIPPTET